MIPKKMNVDQHPNAGKEESSKKVANRFNLHISKTSIGCTQRDKLMCQILHMRSLNMKGNNKQ